jgi:hypothetical protein
VKFRPLTSEPFSVTTRPTGLNVKPAFEGVSVCVPFGRPENEYEPPALVDAVPDWVPDRVIVTPEMTAPVTAPEME